MKNSFNTITAKNEAIYTTKLHWISYIKPVLLMVISLPLLVFSLFSYYYAIGSTFKIIFALFFAYLAFKGIVGILSNRMTKIYLTPNYLTLETGILAKNLNDIALNKYEGISVHQNLLGRILNYGVLVISTGEIAQAYQIENPLVLRKNILKSRG